MKFNVILVFVLLSFSFHATCKLETNIDKKIEMLEILLEQDNLDEYTRNKYHQDLTYLKSQNLTSNKRGGFGTASFSGIILDDSGNPVVGHSILLDKFVLGVHDSYISGTSDGSGNFTINNLGEGDYIIKAGGPYDDYIDYIFKEAIDGGPMICSGCTEPDEAYIHLADAEVKNGVDFTIQIGGIINGSLKDATTLNPVTTQVLTIYTDTQPLALSYYFLRASVEPSGDFSVKGIPDGDYRIFSESSYFEGTNIHVPQIYGGDECNFCYRLYVEGDGTVVTISSANTLNNIDFLLNTGSTISGRLVDALSLNPLAEYNYIYVVDETNVTIAQTFFEGTNYDPLETGDYLIGGLLPGSYYVQGGDLGKEYYMRELYANKPCYWSGCDRSEIGDAVVLGVNEDRLGINFLLEKGGKIAGNIVDEVTGSPIPKSITDRVYVQIYDSSENVVGGGTIRDRTTGDYISARAIPAGNYTLRTGGMFLGYLNAPYVNEKFNDVACAGLACDLSTVNILVANETTTTGIDFDLSQGYSFSGAITDISTGDPIPGVHVLAYKDMGAGLEPKFANWATTSDGTDGSAIGDFEVSGLPAGTYYAVTNNGSRLPFIGQRTVPGDGWVDILYNGMPCPGIGCDIATGTPIILPVILKRGSSPVIDFTLSQGASISGKVISFGDNAFIPSVFINVFDDLGNSMGSYQTDADGNYHTAGFSAGTYYLTTNSHDALVDVKYGNEYCFESDCNPLDATPLVLSSQQSASEVNFIIRPDYIFRNNLE